MENNTCWCCCCPQTHVLVACVNTRERPWRCLNFFESLSSDRERQRCGHVVNDVVGRGRGGGGHRAMDWSSKMLDVWRVRTPHHNNHKFLVGVTPLLVQPNNFCFLTFSPLPPPTLVRCILPTANTCTNQRSDLDRAPDDRGQLKLVQLVLMCTANPDHEIAVIPLHFWYRFCRVRSYIAVMLLALPRERCGFDSRYRLVFALLKYVHEAHVLRRRYGTSFLSWHSDAL